MKRNTKAKGDMTEIQVLSALVQIYPAALIPFGDNQRYDLVFENDDGDFKRVQCKTGRYREGRITFNTASLILVGNGRQRDERRTYEGEIDFFGVVCPDFEAVMLVPIEVANNASSFSLRVDPQERPRPDTNWAVDYLIFGSLEKI